MAKSRRKLNFQRKIKKGQAVYITWHGICVIKKVTNKKGGLDYELYGYL